MKFWRSIVRSTSVCVCLSVCQRGYLRYHTRDLYQFFCACCLWPWLGPPPTGWRNPKGKGQFWGLLPHWQCIVQHRVRDRYKNGCECLVVHVVILAHCNVLLTGSMPLLSCAFTDNRRLQRYKCISISGNWYCRVGLQWRESCHAAVCVVEVISCQLSLLLLLLFCTVAHFSCCCVLRNVYS